MKHTIQIVLAATIMTLSYLCMAPPVSAKCTGTQIEKLVDKGFSKSEINDLCGGGGSSRPEGIGDEEEDTGSTTSTTCRYTMGPKAGQTQYFRPGTPGLVPAYVGGPCTDGMGSIGTAVPDRRRR
jgi:hypothetical protein